MVACVRNVLNLRSTTIRSGFRNTLNSSDGVISYDFDRFVDSYEKYDADAESKYSRTWNIYMAQY